jgi:hypothetical protein
MLFAVGPTVARGTVDTTRYTQIDVAPTIGSFLEFATPFSQGTVIQTSNVVTNAAFPRTIPGQQDLLSMYPNPFNPSTTIEFRMDIGSRVRISVFDVAGRRIETLLDNVMPAGTSLIRWRPSVPSGMYIVVLETQFDGVHATRLEAKKIVLLR